MIINCNVCTRLCTGLYSPEWMGGRIDDKCIRMTPKKKIFKEGKINYATVSKPPKNEWAERQGRKEKGRALQSKLFLKFFFVSIISPCSRLDSAKPQPGDHAAR